MTLVTRDFRRAHQFPQAQEGFLNLVSEVRILSGPPARAVALQWLFPSDLPIPATLPIELWLLRALDIRRVALNDVGLAGVPVDIVEAEDLMLEEDKHTSDHDNGDD